MSSAGGGSGASQRIETAWARERDDASRPVSAAAASPSESGRFSSPSLGDIFPIPFAQGEKVGGLLTGYRNHHLAGWKVFIQPRHRFFRLTKCGQVPLAGRSRTDDVGSPGPVRMCSDERYRLAERQPHCIAHPGPRLVQPPVDVRFAECAEVGLVGESAEDVPQSSYERVRRTVASGRIEPIDLFRRRSVKPVASKASWM